MALLMKAGKLHFLILRYEFFQKRIRKQPFVVDEKRLTNYYFYLFIVSGFLVMIYQLTKNSDLLSSEPNI